MTTPNQDQDTAPKLNPELALRWRLAGHSFFQCMRADHVQPMVDFMLQLQAEAAQPAPAPLQVEAEQALTAQLNEAAAKGLPFPVGGALTSIKTLLERDPCSHAKTAIAMIDAILLHGCAAQPAPVQPDIADIIAGELKVSRGTAYDMMREALALVQPAPAQESMAYRKTGWAAPRDQYSVPVLFNPYTGQPRDVRDVQSDPQGILIVPPGKVEMLAAQPAPVQPVAWPDCWVVVKDGKIIAAHDAPGRYDGIDAVRYTPPAQPAPVQPVAWTEEQLQFLNFLFGAGEWDGVWFEEKHQKKPGAYWWRSDLRRLFSAPPAQQAAQLSPCYQLTKEGGAA